MDKPALLARSALFCALALAALLTACSRQSPGQAVVYPAQWPIARLTVPPASSACPVHMFGPDYQESSFHAPDFDPNTRLSIVGFHSEQSWADIEKHVQACLGAGFAVTSRVDSPAVQSVNIDSADGRYSVRLSGLKMQGMQQWRYDLAVFEYLDASASKPSP